MNNDEWQLFENVVERRRAVRDFDGREVPEDDLRAVLRAATLAPSSSNLQPYRFYVVRDPVLKDALAEACNGQRAARTAGALIVVTSSRELALESLAHLEREQRESPYHAKTHRTLRRFLRFAPTWIVGAVGALLSIFLPRLTLLPFGRAGVRQWAARNSVYAAQTLMLAASARGLDTCPMEGFDALKVGHILSLPRDVVVPLVVAVGFRADDAILDVRVRRPLTEVTMFR